MSIELKVKVKSLAAEAVIIRKEERKAKNPSVRSLLADHRRGTVRRAARCSLLAYGYLRGTQYRAMETTCHEDPDWTAIEKMIRKYGSLKQPIEEWKNEPRRTSDRERDPGEAEDSTTCAA